MKKLTVSLLTASLLAGALYASGNSSQMENMTMEEMKSFHKECLAQMNHQTSKLKNMSQVQEQHLQSLSSDNTNIYEG